MADVPIYVTADRRRAVRGGDPDGRVLLVPAGHPIPADVQARYGLTADGSPIPKKTVRKKTARKKTAAEG